MKCYLVNLDRAPDRLEASSRLFREAGIPFERIRAVDGSQLTPAERRAACPPFRFYLGNAHRVLPGEIGCALSHLQCWKTAFAGGEPLAAVFEDDVEFKGPALLDALEAIERGNDPAIPTVWLLHKGVPRPKELGGRPWFDILETDDIGHVFCTPAYALNAAAARRLAKLLTPLANVADAWSMYARSGVRVLALATPCAAQRKVSSTIEYRPNFWWRQAWFRRLHWFRWRMAFRLDLFLKRLEGKRPPVRPPAP